jgi:general secretion pathway protein J
VILTGRSGDREGQRGMTLLEILVSLAVLAMIAMLIYGAFDSLGRGKKGESLRAERARQGRGAVLRIVREVSSAFLSLHAPQNLAQNTRVTAFIATSSMDYDRLDFTSFAHHRTQADLPESDQAEIGYFVVSDPDKPEKKDLVRREQVPIDLDPKKGGVVNVLAEDVERFNLRFLDPITGQWVETWDTTNAVQQGGRLPIAVEVTLTLANVPPGIDKTYMTRAMIPMPQPLTFAVPR